MTIAEATLGIVSILLWVSSAIMSEENKKPKLKFWLFVFAACISTVVWILLTGRNLK